MRYCDALLCLIANTRKGLKKIGVRLQRPIAAALLRYRTRPGQAIKPPFGPHHGWLAADPFQRRISQYRIYAKALT
jgi:hypothetical protein